MRADFPGTGKLDATGLGNVDFGLQAQDWSVRWVTLVNDDSPLVQTANALILVETVTPGGQFEVIGWGKGIPFQGGPFLVPRARSLRLVVAGGPANANLAAFAQGALLEDGDADPFADSAGQTGPGTFFSGLHADLPDTGLAGHPADVLSSGALGGIYTVPGLIQAPAGTGWRAAMGDPTYPFQFTDGSIRKFYADFLGNLLANSLQFGSASLLNANDYLDLSETGGLLTPAHVQSTAVKEANLVTTLQANAWGVATTAGNLLIAAFQWANAAAVVTPPSGYTLHPDGVQLGAGSMSKATYYKANCSAGEAAPSITISQAASIEVSTAEYSGIAAVTPVDSHASISGNSNTPASGTGATTTQTFELWIATMQQTGAAPVFSAPTNGFTIRQQGNRLVLLDKIVTATGVPSTAVSSTLTAVWTGQLLTFKAKLAVPATPGSKIARLYARDKAGTSNLYWKDDAAVEHDLGVSIGTQIRSMWFPCVVGPMTLDSGTVQGVGVVPDAIPSIALSKIPPQGFYFAFTVPTDWASGAITATIYWVPVATDAVAHTIRWEFHVKELVAGTDATLAGTTTPWTGSSAARTANLMVKEPAQAVLTPSAPGSLVKLDIRRLGTDAADTYTGNARVIWVRLDYVSNQ